MLKPFDIFQSIMVAIDMVVANLFRSLLTTLGITIGVASVTAVISIVQGLSYSVSRQFEGIGGNTISISPYLPVSQLLKGQRAHLSNQDYVQIREHLTGIHHVTPRLIRSNVLISTGGESLRTRVIGTTESYQDVNNFYPSSGRFFSPGDNRTRRQVCLIGEKTRKDLALDQDCVGVYIQVGGKWFKIIGVMEERGEMFGISMDNFIVIPYSTAVLMTIDRSASNISIQLLAVDLNRIAEVKENLVGFLRKRHKLKPGQINDFKVETQSEITEAFNNITATISMVVMGIVGISLFVAGIGVMNIMLVSVTERTREIGIRKSLGATKAHILTQFLFEALLLCFLGGVIGLLLGYTAGAVAASAIPNFPPARIPLWAAVFAFGFSALVGLVFGIYPASKAARLTPIEALSHE